MLSEMNVAGALSSLEDFDDEGTDDDGDGEDKSHSLVDRQVDRVSKEPLAGTRYDSTVGKRADAAISSIPPISTANDPARSKSLRQMPRISDQGLPPLKERGNPKSAQAGNSKASATCTAS